MAIGNTQNDTARKINNAIHQKHGTNTQARKLRQQWIDRGLDRKMSFNEYLKKSTPKHKRLSSSDNNKKFTHGKYVGKFIGEVTKKHPDYIEWILVNAPNSPLGKEIIAFFNKYPNFTV
jgi:hypothetical protein